MTLARKLFLALLAVVVLVGLERYALSGAVEIDRTENLPTTISFVLEAQARYTFEVDTPAEVVVKWSLKGPAGTEVDSGRELVPHSGPHRIVLSAKESGRHSLSLQLAERDFTASRPTGSARLVLRKGDYRILSPLIDRLVP